MSSPSLLRRRPLDPVLVFAIGGTVFAALGAALFFGLFVWQSLPGLAAEGLGFLTGTRWFYRAGEFGAAPMLYGSLAVALVALAIAVPLGLGTATFSAEIAPGWLRAPLRSAVELLAAVPSVVYGLLGVLLLRDRVFALLEPFDPLSGDTLATGGLLLAAMVLPTVTSLADDALRGVPAGQRRAARALGLTRAETIVRVVVPAAAPGLAAAVLLAFGRAIGETIAVFLVVGRQDNQWPERLLSLRPLAEAGQTLTTKLGGSELQIAYGDPAHWSAMMGLGLLLLLVVAVVTGAGALLAVRHRERRRA